MAQVVTIDTKTAKTLIEVIRDLADEVSSLRETLEPPYGSKEWWEWSERKADEDIKAGRVVSFDSVEEAIKWLNS